MFNSFDMFLYTILSVFTVVCVITFLRSSGKIGDKTKNNKAVVSTQDKIIAEYIADANKYVCAKTANITCVPKDEQKNLLLSNITGQEDPNAFLAMLSDKFKTIITEFVNRNVEYLCHNITDTLFKQFKKTIDKLVQYQVKQTIDFECKFISITSIDVSHNSHLIKCDLISEQLNYVDDNNGISYDNPNKIKQFIKYNLEFIKQIGEKNWLLNRIAYRETL